MMRRLVLLISLLSLAFFASPLTASAFDPLNVQCTGDAAQSAVCTDKSNGHSDKITQTITAATHIVALIAGIAAIIILIVGGLRYITSSGDSNNITAAKNTIINALIGIAIIVVAQSIIVFVVDRL